MKIINKYLGLLFFASFILTSCNDDDLTGASQIDYSPAVVTLTSSDNDVVVDESALDPDSPMTISTITATITEPLPINLVIPLNVLAGSTGDSYDFSVGEDLVIPAFSTSGSTNVTIEKTGDIEGDESLTIVAGSVANATVNPFALNVSITNDYINDVLNLTMAWDGTATLNDVTLNSFCNIDFDLLLFDDANNLLGFFDLATSSCPEEGSLSGLADGIYFLAIDLYDNPYSSLGFTDTIPLSVTWSQDFFDNEGSISNSLYNLSMSSGTNLIIQLEVNNGYNYTLSEL